MLAKVIILGVFVAVVFLVYSVRLPDIVFNKM